MFCRRTATAALALDFVLASVDAAHAGQDRATPQEVIQRVQQAAQDLAKSGEAGLATFSSKNATAERPWEKSIEIADMREQDISGERGETRR